MDKEKSKQNPENIRVIIRCRPMTSKEKKADYKNVVKVSNSRKIIKIWDPKKPNDPTATDGKMFTFDAVYGWNSNQELLYQESVRPLVDSVLDGYNATVFAYGQTGTGKTYTMEGVQLDACGKGLMPRSFDHIFDHVNRHPEEEYIIYCSYLQLYQDEIKDLLNELGTKTCELKGDTSSVYVKNLTVYQCKNVENMYRIMKIGNRNRKTGRTDMNEASSRSHAIFTIAIEMCKTVEGFKYKKLGKLNLVDLAGSERHSKSHSTGLLFKEAAKINLSLTALGKVISALTNEKPTHIPYRDSKLTKLLQDSLGGNAKTLMIANIGPACDNYVESLNTLMYATRAKYIKNKPLINEQFTAEGEIASQQVQPKVKVDKDCQTDMSLHNNTEIYCGDCGVSRIVQSCEMCGSTDVLGQKTTKDVKVKKPLKKAVVKKPTVVKLWPIDDAVVEQPPTKNGTVVKIKKPPTKDNAVVKKTIKDDAVLKTTTKDDVKCDQTRSIDDAVNTMETNVINKVFEKVDQMKKEKEMLERKRDKVQQGSREYDLYDIRCYRKDLEIGITMYQTFQYMVEKNIWEASEESQDENRREIEKMIGDYNESVRMTQIPDELKKQFQYPAQPSDNNETVFKDRQPKSTKSEPKSTKSEPKSTKNPPPETNHGICQYCHDETIDCKGKSSEMFDRKRQSSSETFNWLSSEILETLDCKRQSSDDQTTATKSPVSTTLPYFYGRKTVQGRRDSKFRDDVTIRVNSLGIKQYYIGDKKLSDIPKSFPDDPPSRESKFKDNVSMPQYKEEPLFKYLGNNRFMWRRDDN